VQDSILKDSLRCIQKDIQSPRAWVRVESGRHEKEKLRRMRLPMYSKLNDPQIDRKSSVRGFLRFESTRNRAHNQFPNGDSNASINIRRPCASGASSGLLQKGPALVSPSTHCGHWDETRKTCG